MFRNSSYEVTHCRFPQHLPSSGGVAPQLLTTSNFIGSWYHTALLFSGLGSIVLLFGVLFSQQIREDLVRAATSPFWCLHRTGRHHRCTTQVPRSAVAFWALGHQKPCFWHSPDCLCHWKEAPAANYPSGHLLGLR